jgi:hypothetical protein
MSYSLLSHNTLAHTHTHACARTVAYVLYTDDYDHPVSVALLLNYDFPFIPNIYSQPCSWHRLVSSRATINISLDILDRLRAANISCPNIPGEAFSGAAVSVTASCCNCASQRPRRRSFVRRVPVFLGINKERVLSTMTPTPETS